MLYCKWSVECLICWSCLNRLGLLAFTENTILKSYGSISDNLLNVRWAWKLVLPGVVVYKAVVFNHFLHLWLELNELVLAPNGEEVTKRDVFFTRELRVICKLDEKLFDACLSLHDWVWVFLLESHECFFRWKHRYEEARIFAVNSHSEEVKITVAPLYLDHLRHAWIVLEAELPWWARPKWIDLEHIMPGVHHIVTVPSWSTDVYMKSHLEINWV